MTGSTLRKLALLTLGVLALVAPRSAHAFSYLICDGVPVVWVSGGQEMTFETPSFPAGSLADQRLRDAIAKWNQVIGSDFQFSVGTDADGTHDIFNDLNEVYLDSDLNAITMTVVRPRCRGLDIGLDEVDIAFNSDVAWSLEPYSYANPSGAPFNFEGTALHEFGHALGLLHEDRVLTTMNAFYPHGGPLGSGKQWIPFGDDREGARFLYPSNDLEVDIAASALKQTQPGAADVVASPSLARAGSPPRWRSAKSDE